MTPERISELRKWVGEHVLEGQCLVDVDTDEVLDLLDTAEREAKLRDYAQQVAKWEADLILSQDAWGGGTREFPQFTAELYDRWMELQAVRNAALETNGGES